MSGYLPGMKYLIELSFTSVLPAAWSVHAAPAAQAPSSVPVAAQ